MSWKHNRLACTESGWETPDTENKQYKEFLHAVRTFHVDRRRTLGPGEESFTTAWGPVLDAEMEKEMRDQHKTLFLAVLFNWQDGKGTHVSERCAWVQPDSFLPNHAEVWQTCRNTEGVEPPGTLAE